MNLTLTPLKDNFVTFNNKFITEGPKSVLANGNKEERADFNFVKTLSESEQTFIEAHLLDRTISIALINSNI